MTSRQAGKISTKLLILILVIIVLIAAATIGYFLLGDTPKSKEVAVDKAQSEAAALLEEAQTYTKTTKKNKEELGKLADQTSNQDARIVYRQAQAEAAMEDDDFATARDAELEVEKAKPSADSAALLGYAYRALGDYTNSAKYFRLAAERSPKSSTDSERSAYNDYMIEAKDSEAQAKESK